MNYTFLDAYASVKTAASSTIGGVEYPIVKIPDTVAVSVVGHAPVVIVGGSILTSATANQSVSGTIGASVIGQAPVNIISWGGAGTPPSGNGVVSVSTPRVAIASDSAGPGSVVAFQGTTPWVVSSVYGNISGSVVAFQGTSPWVTVPTSGSVIAVQSGTQSPSVYGMRNDAVASFLGANLTTRPLATDAAGRTLAKPFAAEEARVEGYISLTSTSVTTLVAAAGAGLRNYITDAWFANTGASATLVTFKDGAGSILGYTVAPAGGGSNLQGLQTPIRTGANATFDIQAGTATSILYGTVKGYKAP